MTMTMRRLEGRLSRTRTMSAEDYRVRIMASCVRLAVSNEVERYHMKAIHVELDGRETRMISTDTYRMHTVAIEDGPEGSTGPVISQKLDGPAIERAAKLGDAVLQEWGAGEMFPPWTKVFDKAQKDRGCTMTIRLETLAEALGRSVVLQEPRHTATVLDLETQNYQEALIVRAQPYDGEFSETIRWSCFEGRGYAGFKYGVNPGYLLDALQMVAWTQDFSEIPREAQFVKLGFAESGLAETHLLVESPMIKLEITPRAVIMPVRL
jgi:DNA polymerase III sliding clamp (beta) subunit (PCNA family)